MAAVRSALGRVEPLPAPLPACVTYLVTPNLGTTLCLVRVSLAVAVAFGYTTAARYCYYPTGGVRCHNPFRMTMPKGPEANSTETQYAATEMEAICCASVLPLPLESGSEVQAQANIRIH